MNHTTALVSCFDRAFHVRNNQTHIFSDPAAYLLLKEDYARIAQHMTEGIPFFLPGFTGSPEEGLRRIVDGQLSPSVLGRSAFCEQMLKEAVTDGCEQYLLLGAGYDTFGIRNPFPSLTVYEADLPDLLADKQNRMQKAGLHSCAEPVPCDLSDPEWVNTLQKAGFDCSRQTFVSLLGISYYLSNDSFHALLSKLGRLLSNRSQLCFDIPLEEAGHEAQINRALAQEAGEPMKAVYTSAELLTMLKQCGFKLQRQLSPKQMTEQYFSAYNTANPDHRIVAPKGVSYVLAEGKKGTDK